MYARSTTVRGDPKSVDAGIAYVRDTVMPLVEGLEGWVGLSMLCDRDSGRCIVTTSWSSEDARRASASMVRASRARAGEIMGDPSPEMHDWEIAVMHRLHEAHNGACARVIWARHGAAGMDAALEEFRTSLLPRMEQLPGFCSVSMMLDRDGGQSATAVIYDDHASMMAANSQAVALRQEFAETAGMEITEVAEFDLVLAHLRVPEMV